LNTKVSLSSAVAGLGTAITAWLGGWDAALQALVLFMVLDYITGLLAAVWHRRVDSEVMFRGGIRKAIILVVVAIGVMLDKVAGNPVPLFRTMIVYYYVAREGLSVIENIGLLGVPLPQFLIRTLAQLQPPDEEDKGNGKEAR
jgi:toxin secretion/phage lysis holin